MNAAAIAKATGMGKFGEDSIGAIMSKYDTDGNGSFSINEVRLIVEDVQNQKSTNKSMKKLILILLLFVFLLIGALVGTSLFGAVVGGMAIKDTQAGADVPETSVPIATAPIESFHSSVFGLANAPTNQLAYLRNINMYVDMTSGPPAGVVESNFQIAAAYKASVTQAFLVTTTGYTITLDAVAQSGTITMDGNTYPVLEEMPSSANGRSLALAGVTVDPIPTVNHKTHYTASRRKLRHGNSFSVSGSFNLQSGSSGRRLDEHGREMHGWGMISDGSSYVFSAANDLW